MPKYILYLMHYHHLYSHFTTSGSSFLGTLLGAFLGAFFAAIFGFITYIITKRRERFVEHKNSLVKLERVLNKHLNDFGTLSVLAKGMDHILGNGRPDVTRLFLLEIPNDIDMKLGSIDLCNKFLTYQICIDRINHNASSINHALTRIEDLFISGQPVVAENFNLVRDWAASFQGSLSEINEVAKKFLVWIRIHNHKLKNKNTFAYGAFKITWEQDVSVEEIKGERSKLDSEIKNILSKSNADMF